MIQNIREARALKSKLKSKAMGLSTNQKIALREMADGTCYMPCFRLRETLGSDIFDAVTLDASHNSLIAGYGNVPDTWAEVAQVVSTSDFKTMNASSLAGLPNLPIVPQAATYLELKQLDEKVSYPIQKRGGILAISLEASAGDALGAFNRDSERLGAAAKTTLNEFVIGTLFDDNPNTDYDSVALWGGTGHANTVAVDGVNLANVQAGVAKIMAQTGRNGEQIYLMPTTLIVQPSMMMEALALVNSTQLMPQTFPVGANSTTVVTGMSSGNTNPLPQFIKKVVTTPHVNADATQYFLVCDPAQNPIIQIAFLNGRREPEIFKGDMNQGAGWRRDAIEWKVRHVYGGDVVDHRPGCRIGA